MNDVDTHPLLCPEQLAMSKAHDNPFSLCQDAGFDLIRYISDNLGDYLELTNVALSDSLNLDDFIDMPGIEAYCAVAWLEFLQVMQGNPASALTLLFNLGSYPSVSDWADPQMLHPHEYGWHTLFYAGVYDIALQAIAQFPTKADMDAFWNQCMTDYKQRLMVRFWVLVNLFTYQALQRGCAEVDGMEHALMCVKSRYTGDFLLL